MPVGEPFIPRDITVHLGRPDAAADNVTVAFPDYITADSGGGKFRSHHCRHSICIRQRPCESARCRVR